MGERNIAQPQNLYTGSIFHRLVKMFRKVRSGVTLIYNKRKKIVEILISVIKNPYNLKTISLVSQFVSEKIELTEHLDEKLSDFLANNEYIISISHTNYTQNVGGVEIRIMDEQKAYNKGDIDYLHIYPILARHPELGNELRYFGINCNGDGIGVTDREGLLSTLTQLHTKRLLDIFIHHTMGFDIALINQILEIGGRKGRFWLHDNFSICPNYTLLRNDLIYCGAPNINSKACLTCKHGYSRRMQQPTFAKLFEDNDLEIVAPSQFALDLWIENSSYPLKTGKIIPHLKLSWNSTAPIIPINTPLRIGFIGYPVYWKGWDTWLLLANKYSDDARYQFFCFTSWDCPSTMKRVSVSVTRDNRLSMIEALKENYIDVAFLWSLCPETFSFTLYESLAAGCYILTYKDSGNIQAYLKENTDHGLVLDNEQTLFDLFSGNHLYSLVANYQKIGKPLGELTFLPEFE